jgi:hypothetical protein
MQTLHEYSSFYYQLKRNRVLKVYKQMLQAISQMTVGKRGGRIEPRAIKRRTRQYDLLNRPRKELQKNLKKNA